ncbi:hypothetical protein GGP99_001950 [Salinibacter ruber]|uniref:Uncharacterized protein n=1 Tax=Salinibacter ruber TaxID=146919 RepID=A0AAW5P7X4_9BACT|nr:hypothetical protein [Salinibacter ruber]
MFLDDIKNQPYAVLHRICQWLGVREVEWPEYVNEKYNAAKVSQFPWLSKQIEWLTSMLHSYKLHQVVEYGKKLGLKEAIYSEGEDEIPKLSDEDRIQLIEEYNNDISFVEKVTGRDISCWRK